MSVRVLIIGNDVHIHKLVVDIIEITFKEVTIDRAANEEALLSKLDSQEYSYNLIIFDCHNDKETDEELITSLKNTRPHLLDHLIVLIDSEAEKPAEEVLQKISYVIKPFSLDEFGELVKKIVLNKTK